MKDSKRFTLNSDDLKRSLNNALIFAGPALLILLADVLQKLPEWVEGPYLVIALWFVNWVTDLLRKYVSGK